MGLGDDAGADVGGVGGFAFVFAAVADGEAEDVDGEACPGGGHADGGGACGAEVVAEAHDDGLGVGLVDDYPDFVLCVGAWEVGGGLPCAGDSLRFGEGGVAEAYLREIALGELEGAVVDFCLAAHDDDGVFVDHGEVVEGSDEGLNPTVLVEADLAGGVEGAGELGEGLEAFAAVGLFGGDFVVLGALGGHSAVGLMTVDDGAIDVAEFA